ncbi:lysocardiolipin and lysophospholipid acyltransferase [Pseudohyphozyma bogoriensis]|nr:lysocardiolipin and lysophospholipid acyltransferase [Pseudohyphozyma bogoriensis]
MATTNGTKAAGGTPPAPLWSLPKQSRPPHGSTLKGIVWAILFNSGIIFISTLQLLCYPLHLFPPTANLYEQVLDSTKGYFGQLAVFISQYFCPTEFVVSAGHGVAGTEWVERDDKGDVRRIRLPDRGVWMANHQTLSDWIYVWSFTYLSYHSTAILIVLKASIRSIPLIGWACSLWGFIFLARNWALDKGPFKRQLERVSRRLKGDVGEEKLALLIFPEGTILTDNTKPVSDKYAEKLGVPNFKYSLLPRSTGLFFTLRTLSSTLPTVSLIDLTIGYPSGTGAAGPDHWPQDYIDLTSWFKGVGPPAIHVHLRVFDVKKEVPLGVLDGSDGTEEEKKVFDEWLRERWSEKEGLLEGFVKEGKFPSEVEVVGEKEGKEEIDKDVRWPLKLRTWREHPAAFAYFLPLLFVIFFGPYLVSVVVAVVGGIGSKVFGMGAGTAAGAVKECGCGKMAEKAVESLAKAVESASASASFGDL